MASFFEMLMVVSFGFAWPLNIIKAWKVRTAKGTSLMFLLVILAGYIFGICAKFIGNNLNYVLVFYFINFFMVGTNTILYFRNRKLDKQREEKNREAA